MKESTWCVVLLTLAMSGWAATPPAEKPTAQKPAPKDLTPFILTPAPRPQPRINGPRIFGVRPGHPFLYRIPATGEQPLEFSVEGLPQGLQVDTATGQITGKLRRVGEYPVVLKAKNAHGESRKSFRIVAGEKIALTPPMGWNTWYSFGLDVDQEKVLTSARLLAGSDLVKHGFSYVNIDDTWQGARTGKDHALQANSKFPDMRAMCDEIHALGLKAGIYSTPWITSYAALCGGTSNSKDGSWSKEGEGNPRNKARYGKERIGKYSFAEADARQWAAWGFDFMKYDWFPLTLPEIISMSKALRASGRDIVFSLSNKAPIELGPELAKWANMWRISGDISDAWEGAQVFLPMWSFCISEVAFAQDRWIPYAGPGHWIDPDMLPVGRLGGKNPQPARLTADEQYSLVSMWCMLAAPLLIGGQLEPMDAFTLNLLTNDEVLALDQDTLGLEAVRAAVDGPVDIYKKPLDDGTVALGFFNRSPIEHKMSFNKMIDIGLAGRFHVRDLWRQKDLPDASSIVDMPDRFRATIPGHGVLLVKLAKIK